MTLLLALPLALLAVGALVGMVVAIKVRGSRPGLSLGLGVTAGVVLVALAGALAAPFLLDNRDPNIWVLGVGDESPQFSADVEHHRVSVEGERYVFTTDLTEAELIGALDAVYPAGEPGGLGLWHVTLGDSAFVLTELADPSGAYAVSSEPAG